MKDANKSKKQLITELTALRRRVIALEEAAKTRQDEEASATHRETELLLQAATAITETLSLDERLDRILEQLEKVVVCESTSVQLLYDGYLEIVGGRGWSDFTEIIGVRFPFPGDNPNTEVIQYRQPLFLATPSAEYNIFIEERFSQINSWLGLPLIVQDKVIGLLALDNLKSAYITADQMRFAATFAGQVAIAIENARLFKQTQQQAEHLNQILDISALLHRGLELETVFEQIVEGALRLGFRVALMNVYDPDEDQVTIPVMAGVREAEYKILANATYSWVDDFESLMQERFRISRSYMIRHNEFDWEKNYRAISISSPIEYRGPGYWHPDDALIIPMWSTQKKPLGVLWVDEPVDDRIPGLETIRLLELLANQGAIALENARLYKQIRQDAETKATLLREVNHRVQNNLTAIIGMINFEQTRPELKDQPGYQAIMQNLSNRIWGMAIAHRMLSGTSWSPVLLSDLAARIIASVVQTQSSNKRFTVDLPPSSILVSAKYASSLALIINELATNTVKYALKDRSVGRIAVRIDNEGDAILFEYQDDGPGYPADVLQKNCYNVGLQLVRGITESDLAGKLSLRNNSGAVASIRFIPDNYDFA